MEVMTRWIVWVTILHASFNGHFPGKSGLASCPLEVNSLGAKFYDQTWHQPISPFLHPLTHVSGLRWLSHGNTPVWVTVLPVMCWFQYDSASIWIPRPFNIYSAAYDRSFRSEWRNPLAAVMLTIRAGIDGVHIFLWCMGQASLSCYFLLVDTRVKTMETNWIFNTLFISFISYHDAINKQITNHSIFISVRSTETQKNPQKQ